MLYTVSKGLDIAPYNKATVFHRRPEKAKLIDTGFSPLVFTGIGKFLLDGLDIGY
jgi:hypothetical protein